MKPYNVCGLGNALVDILLELSEPEFAALGFERATMRLVDQFEQLDLLRKFHSHDPRLASGGSVANSIIALSQLGGQGAFIGCVGDDRYGLFYKTEFDELNIDIGNPIIVEEQTGTCLSIITPDAERTMRTCLAVSSRLAARHIDADRIAKSEWLFVEGYVLANPDYGQSAVREAVRAAKEAGTKIALTCSEAFIVEVFGDAFRDALKDTSLLFCNAVEACAVTGAADAKSAFEAMPKFIANAVVTDGANGAFVRYGSVEAHVPAYPCTPKDLTGAGDMFAGAFLYGITHEIPPILAARAGNYLAKEVISQIGARLHQGTRVGWDRALSEG
jgi:sugar/nucleoside kinase (ribokinase family)